MSQFLIRVSIAICVFGLSVAPAWPQPQRDDVLRQLAQSRERVRSAAAWEKRRQELRLGFLRGAALWPMPVRTPLNPLVHGRRVYADYTVENVAFESFPGFFCTGNLYRPRLMTKPVPAVLCPHGHFAPLGRFREDQQLRCAHLARMGALVLSYSMVGWQDSEQTTHDDPFVLTLQTWNSIRALDYLCSLPEVDASKIGITGASGGGTQSFYLAALDDRVKASVPVVIVYPWSAPDGCRCEGGMPVMQAADTNAIELAAAAAPRPQLLFSRGQDETRDFPKYGLPFIRQVYGLFGKTELVQSLHLENEAHDYGPSKRRAAYEFFARHLGLRLLSEDREKIVLEDPSRMRVFDARHPLPPSALKGAEQIRIALARLPRVDRSSPPSKPPDVDPVDEALFFRAPGFQHEGVPVKAGKKAPAILKIAVRDQATGKTTPCRINVVGRDGHFYQPEENYLTPFAMTGEWPKPGAWGNRPGKAPYRYLGRFFYSWGEATVAVPPGPVRIEVWKGIEYRPESLSTIVAAGVTRPVEIVIARALSGNSCGYYSGDTHLHFPRESERDDQAIFDLLEAEDIQYGTPLAYNEPAGPYHGFMNKMASPQNRGLGAKSIRRRGSYQILSGQEYRSSTYGHLNLYLRDDIVFKERSHNADNWPVYGNVGHETRTLGGYAIHAHGGYAQEIYADAALGNVHAVELLQFGIYRGIELGDWYHMLNSGYRFPCIGASDFPACRWLGDCRTYVHHSARPSFPDWLAGAAMGRSFVTTGPVLLLEVDREKPGGRIARTGPGPHRLRVRARVRCEVTPVTNLALIVNGRTVAQLEVPPARGQGVWLEIDHELVLHESAWVAARAYSTTARGLPDAESHTNPVYIYVNGRAPYQQASLDAWIARIDGQIARHNRRQFAEKSRVLAYFQKARDSLLKIRANDGLGVNDDPAKLAEQVSIAPSGHRDLSADGSIRNPTEQELREFLKPIPAKKPEEALKSFETVDGFRMELVASEPLVYDPVAAAFDEDGNLYVAEMRDYPYKPAAGRPPLGSIRLLRDTDGDGDFDASTVFADKLLWAAGIAPWKGGVFVAAPPDIWYFKDTDGDHKADVRLKVYTGFGVQNQQAMLNNLQWGLDHFIYGATAGNGGTILSLQQSRASPISVDGRDFRFDPATHRFEAITGTIQFGNTFDDWGNRFVCSESQPLLHVVLPQHYLARNPFLPVPTGIHNLAVPPVPIFRISPIERWRHLRSSRRVAKNERSAESPGASHHVVDAAAGVTIYRGGAYPREYYGTVFVGDAQNNLIHHRRLEPSGVTFRSERIEKGKEVVRSSDIWFRPVNFINAPDGTLYCLDMSREVLESIHIPLDVVKHLDLTNGRNHGRIYRLAPPGFRSPPPPRYSRAGAEQLVAALESPHGWHRDTAHRLIYERQDLHIVPSLERLVAQSTMPQARLHALWSLAGLKKLREEVLLTALADRHPDVREHAVRLCEPLLATSSRLVKKLGTLSRDPSARVRFQLAFTLGELTEEQLLPAFLDLLRNDANDMWMRTAVMSSVSNVALDLMSALLADAAPTAVKSADVLEQLAVVIGNRNRPSEIDAACELLARSPAVSGNPGLQERLFLGLCAGRKRRGEHVIVSATPRRLAEKLASDLWQRSKYAALDSRSSDGQRIRAIQILSCYQFSDAGQKLAVLLENQFGTAVQLAAVRALADYSDSEVARLLLDRWAGLSGDARAEALVILLSRTEFALSLLQAVDRREISPTLIEPGRRSQLVNHRDKQVRDLAQRAFRNLVSPTRSTVLAEYQSVLKLKADPQHGRKIFVQHCAGCHQLGGEGHAIGPNLASASARDGESLLRNILDPNYYVLPNYAEYLAIDRRGLTFSGILASQSATSITLKREKDLTLTVLRSDLEELRNTGRSLMPEEMEKVIGQQDMADLIGYLLSAMPQTAAVGDSLRERDFGTLPGLVEPGK